MMLPRPSGKGRVTFWTLGSGQLSGFDCNFSASALAVIMTGGMRSGTLAHFLVT